MSKLSCSRITLSTGALVTSVNNLTVIGPGQQRLTIDGNDASGVFQHAGYGTLSITDLTLAHGNYANGGCIASLGSAVLTRSTIDTCMALSLDRGAAGGGVLVKRNLMLTSSRLLNNVAFVEGGYEAFGGGAYAGGNISVTSSSITGNSATSAQSFAFGGGLYAGGSVTITGSTIQSNFTSGVVYSGLSRGFGGGAFAYGDIAVSGSTVSANQAGAGAGGLQGEASLTVTNSTIAANSASRVGGLFSLGTLRLNNSTVARNVSTSSEVGSAGGVSLRIDSVFQSSIVADNVAGNPNSTDLAGDIGQSITINGGNNLVGIADPAVTLPNDTLLHIDPMLAAELGDNGGATLTLALRVGSPAIGAGNNIADLYYDQRGAGFPRVIDQTADIGSFESNPDLIFANGFN